MNFALTDEQEQLRAVARRYLADRYPLDRTGALADSADGHDPDGWAPLSGLGWWEPDLGPVEAALLAEQSGYALHPVPWLPALALAGLPGTGATVTAGPVAVTALPERPTLTAADTADGWRLTGRATRVPDLAAASAVVAVAVTPDGPALFRLDPTGYAVRPEAGIDQLRRCATLDCADARASTLGRPGDGTVVTLRRRVTVLLAAEAVGVAQRAYDLAVAHVGVRTQFDRPIGSYQAVAFAVADSYARIELARSLAYRAAWLIGSAEPAQTIDSGLSAALVAARTAAVGATEQAIQAHGGIGMTWEHPLHHWYRRALWLDTFAGASRDHLERIAATLLPA